MERYISIDNAIKIAVKALPVGDTYLAIDVATALEDAPTADVVEVVRCKDCKDFEPHGNGKAGLCKNKKCNGIRYANDYCSYGERKL